ncbi:phosphodiesterase [Bordetella genomosp. 4]|uniref:Phosphodiesterase n=1 Tax=Bordetella genomosp. 4 TaxID=463044 RepID=A0A261V2X7_9BORD|nr:phosphodiesterase [Bordetella genomosp. 4]OZI67880.1 phosphodiesterase [Bordetella genomosp. 4]
MVLSFIGYSGGLLPGSTTSAGRADAPTLLVQLTDLHLMAEPESVMCQVNTDASLRAVMDLVRANGHRPDLLLATGDLAQDGSAQAYQRLRSLLEQTDWPVRCLPGNHDDPRLLRETMGLWAQPVTDIGAWRIILLDSTVPDSNAGHISEEQFDLLEQASALAGDRHVLVALHHNPVQMDSSFPDKMMVDNAQALFQRLANLPRARVLLWGHVHQAFDRRRHHMRLLATPSTCFQFSIRNGQHVLDDSPPGYRWLKLYRDGSLATGVRRLSDAAWLQAKK